MVTHACNPSPGETETVSSLRPGWTTKQDESSNRQETGGLGGSSVAEYLLNMRETINPVPSTGGESKQKNHINYSHIKCILKCRCLGSPQSFQAWNRDR